MIRESFCFLDGVGPTSEKNIWKQGIHDWSQFIDTKSIKGMAAKRKAAYNLQLQKARKNLQVRNLDFFAHQFPQQEHWRLYDHFQDEIAYLDIETSGYYGDITVIGLYDGDQTMTMVKGKNLDKQLLQKTLDKYKMLVTFNGASFDLPVIHRYFNLDLPQAHIDLRHVCAKVGLTGGLKNIEKTLNINRHEDMDGMSGMDAVILWKQYKATGNEERLKKIVQYNEEDIVNLEPLAKHTIKQLWKRTKHF